MDILGNMFNVFSREKNLVKNILLKLEEKHISDTTADLIISYAKKYNDLTNLSLYLNSPTVLYSDLFKNTNLSSLFNSVPVSNLFKDKIINLAGTVDNVNFGKGEIALMLFLKDTARCGEKGDIKTNDYILEVKRGKSQVAESHYTKRLSKSDIFHGTKSKLFINKYNIDLSPGKTWVESIQKSDPNKEELEEVLAELYPNLEINVNLLTPQTLNNSIGLALAKKYFLNKNILFINNKNNNYVYVKDYNEFEKNVIGGFIKFSLASDTIPRCYLDI